MSVLHTDQASNWQLEILMEKLRSKAVQMKSLAEISKNVRMSLLEKRYALDSVEKSQHQKCLDTLQHSIRVTCLQSMVERLESLTRQLGLRFTIESSGVFIFSDMFYLEIVLESSGAVTDVKIHHEGKAEAQSCVELVNCLSRCDFGDFTSQLEGFVSIYELNAEKKVKSKAFTALESLEADLDTLAQLQFYKEPFNIIHKSPVGILEKRRGGHPMKLIYFVSPYELLSVEKNDLEPLTVEHVLKKNLGYSVTVRMEGSAAHKLQIATLVTVNRSINGKSSPTYASLANQNSAVIPACFILKLNKPMPMCLSLVRRIQQIQPWSDVDLTINQPLLNLIVSHSSEGKLSCSNNKGLFVTLPDHNQCYFMTENKNMNGIFVNSIPFTHPGHVANILTILREQALFNTIIESCVRPASRQDFDNMTMFEISALSSTQISISLEHPLEESMATADFDLSDLSNLVCRIHNPGTPPPANTPDPVSETATKILNKSFSIPITLRAVIKMWDKQVASRRTLYMGHENFNLPLGSVDPGGHKGPDSGNGLSEFRNIQDKIKQEPGTHGQSQGNHHAMSQDQQGMWNESMMSSNFQHLNDASLTSMDLSHILSDSSEKASSKSLKRKATDDLWKNPKRRMGSTDDPELVESSSCDSTSRSTLLSQETEIPTPFSGTHSDPENSNDIIENPQNPDKDNSSEIEDLSSGSRDETIKTPSSVSEEKTLEPSTLSITPVISGSLSSTFGSGNISEKRPGVEIIPLSAASLLPSSITITPITTTIKSFDDRKDKKSSSSSSNSSSSRGSREDKSRTDKDKKRKKKRDDSPMGPPKQDPLSRPVSVSIKPSESPTFSSSTPTSPNMMQRFSPSPTSSRSPSLPKHKPSSSHPSPKNSPVHISSSPKYSTSPSMSPKHSSSGATGKPSMSTLKSASGSSPSSKSGDKSKSSKDSGSRDKDKSRSLFGSSNMKSKPSSVKVKPESNEGSQDSTSSSPNNDSKSNPKGNRKGSLSAIVDKLKVNAQNCDIVDLSSKSNPNNLNKDRSTVSKDPKSTPKSGDQKSSEYMVKPSSDGMKLTINKTRTKESKSFSGGNNNVLNATGTTMKNLNTSSSGSPKVHTGLKPGVTSGPASKKPQQIQKSSSTSNVSNSTTFNSSSIKTSSSSSGSSSSTRSANLTNLSKSTSKPGSGTTKSSSGDVNRLKDKMKPSKSSTEKSIFSSVKGKSSPTPNDLDGMFKVQAKDLYTSPLAMEGMMKALDKNFQIPKLSARSSEDKKKSDPNNVNKSTADSKIFDIASKNDLSITKYPLALPTASIEQKIRNNMSGSKESEGKNNSFISDKSIDLTSKFASHHSNAKKDDDVLDFSKIPAFSHSASMSVKVIEAPGSMNSIGARSVPENSPLTPDDEFTEESIVGK